MFAFRHQVRELVVLELELDVLVEVVLDLGVDALLERADGICLFRAHRGCFPWLPATPRSKALSGEMFHGARDSFATGASRLVPRHGACAARWRARISAMAQAPSRARVLSARLVSM